MHILSPLKTLKKKLTHYKLFKDKHMNSNKIIRYVRTPDGQPLGCVVAIGHGCVGWSFCRKGDQFTKKMAIQIAESRALIGTSAQMPRSVVPLFNKVLALSLKKKW